ncbi:RND family transporter [candidate division CSSED10-310 bacterium]|uniref:RND family transporter n=1 Tax=candidate division CSSED10-310 bacterium TaxID=2855610 RepID=A0ABV6Z4T7_UNCC1
MDTFFTQLIRFPKSILLTILAITFFFGSQLKHIRMETDAESMIPQRHPAIIFNDKVEEIFDLKDAIIIGVVNEQPAGIFNAHTLELVKKLTEEIALLDGVVAVTDDDVVSLATLDHIVGTASGFDVSPYMEDIPQTKEDLALLKEKLYDSGMYIGGIVSQDGTATAIFAELESGLKNRAAVYKNIKDIISNADYQTGPEKVYLAGRPVLEVTFGEYMSEDMRQMMPLVNIVIILVLFLTFRTILGVILPLIVVIGSVIWSLGTMSLCGIPLFTISTQMPIILMAVGTAYGIHILNKYYQELDRHPQGDRRVLILETMREKWKPVVMTALTTVVGFLSLVTAYMVPIRYFGIFTSVGVLAAMIISLTLIPASLMLFPGKKRKGLPQSTAAGSGGNRWSEKMLGTMGGFIYDQRKMISLMTAVIIVVSLVGIFTISTNSSWIENIKHSSEVYISNQVMNEKFDGTISLYVIVEGKTAGVVKSPQVLMKIDALQQDVEQLKHVGGSRSIAEYLKRMNRVMNEDKKEFEKVPQTQELAAQYLLMYSMSGDPEDFNDVVDYDYRLANIWIQVKSDYTKDLEAVINRVETFAKTHFQDQPVAVKLAGRAYTSFIWVDLLVRGQMNSIIFSIVTVFLITALMFRSVVAGIFNIIPISAAMLLNFGMMGLLGLPLDVSTALSSGIIIGVGIDYTIHFLSKYHWEMNKGQDERRTSIITMQTTGRAIIFNAIAVISGFLVLYSSNFPSNRHLGGLVSVNMFTSALAAITILPALLIFTKPAFMFRQGRCKDKK